MAQITEKAFAKVNLGLDILGKRNDGYYEVCTVMQSIGLSDEVIIEEGQGIQITTNIPELSCDTDNLAYKATALLAQEAGIEPNVHITLNKNIFIAAGLAGGSSDAAAVLRGLNKYWQLQYNYNKLEAIAAKIGSEVPFCIQGGSAVTRGRGKVIEHLEDMPQAFVVLVKPKNLEISKAWVYDNFVPQRVIQHPVIWRMAELLPHGIDAICPCLGNVLETVTIPAHPIIASLKAAMLKAGANYTIMSGSGPTVFALADTPEKAQAITAAVAEFDVETAVTTTVGRIK